jgi:tetratricopeptide (TPR) repeat protein
VKKFAVQVFAFCTFLTVLIVPDWAHAVPPNLGENFAHYNKTQIQWGATTLPLAAQLTYKAAIYELEAGNLERATSHLQNAIRLDPGLPDAYFTLSKIKFRQFDPDALYNLVLGVRAMLGRFESQGLLAVNGLLTAVLLLVMITTIVCVSFATRYLPFLAHKIAELLEHRFNAALPRATAYLIILMPFALLPGFVSGVCLLLLMAWYFMQRREKFMMMVLIAPFVLLGVFAPELKQFNPLADARSFTQLAAKSTHSAGNALLIKAVDQVSIPRLEAEKHIVLGQLHYRQENFDTAASHFLRTIEQRPDDIMGYINLGNVYYSQGMYEKALEGYRKAAQIDDADPVGQYNLAQAYIKTLLMAESSEALKKASAGGIDGIKRSYAEMARPLVQVYPKTFSDRDLWRISRVEGMTHETDFLSQMLQPLTRMSTRMSAWLLLGALVLAMLLSRAFRKKSLTFQCSNCGELTCDNCGEDTGSTFLCPSCAGVIEGVSSDKVIEALLRQRRQGVLVRRRRAIRMLTLWLPGMRDIYYGRITRGVLLTLTFSFSLIQLWSRGYIVKDWNSLVTTVGLWKWILPAAGIVLTYALSVFSKRYLEVRNYRSPSVRARKKDSAKDDGFSAKSVSA